MNVSVFSLIQLAYPLTSEIVYAKRDSIYRNI